MKTIDKWILIITVCLGFSSFAAEIPATKCEVLLDAPEGKFSDAHSRHVNAYYNLSDALDMTPGLKKVTFQTKLKAPALDAFNLGGLTRLERDQLRLRTQFDKHSDEGELPEIELFVSSGLAHKDRLIELMTGSRAPMYLWRNVGDPSSITEGTFRGEDLKKIPWDQEVGFFLESSPAGIKRYVSGQLISQSKARIVLGIEVECAQVDQFTGSRQPVGKVITPHGLRCRIPVLTTLAPIERDGDDGPNDITLIQL